MGYIQEDKKNNIKEDYIPDWFSEIKEEEFNPELISGINSPQIKQNIGIQN